MVLKVLGSTHQSLPNPLRRRFLFVVRASVVLGQVPGHRRLCGTHRGRRCQFRGRGSGQRTPRTWGRRARSRSIHRRSGGSLSGPRGKVQAALGMGTRVVVLVVVECFSFIFFSMISFHIRSFFLYSPFSSLLYLPFFFLTPFSFYILSVSMFHSGSAFIIFFTLFLDPFYNPPTHYFFFT